MESRRLEEAALESLAKWFAHEHEHQEGESDRYIVCAGLAVLEVFKHCFPIKESDYITPRNQVKTGGPLIQKVLKDHGEERRYALEGGRRPGLLGLPPKGS
jgi:hypothetical protein